MIQWLNSNSNLEENPDDHDIDRELSRFENMQHRKMIESLEDKSQFGSGDHEEEEEDEVMVDGSVSTEERTPPTNESTTDSFHGSPSSDGKDDEGFVEGLMPSNTVIKPERLVPIDYSINSKAATSPNDLHSLTIDTCHGDQEDEAPVAKKSKFSIF